MELSISSLKQFEACRRAYQLRKIYGIVPVETSDALATGLAYHEMVERFTLDGELPTLDSKEAAMVHAYAKYIAPDMPKFEPEVSFKRVCGKENMMVGRIDGRVIGENAIVEHKTTSLSVDEFEYDLQWDEQLLTYFWANNCNTAYYTVCRKPTIRQRQNETAEEFAQRCLDWYGEDDTLSKIRLLKVTRTDEEIQLHKKHLVKMFSEIRKAERSNNFYRNSCHCNSWGRKCEYAPICLHYDPNEEYVGFVRR